MRARSTIVATVGLVVESSGVTSPATVICSADLRHLQGGIDHGALAGGQDGVALPALHAGNGDRESYSPVCNGGKHVEAGGIGCGLKLIFRLDVFERHGGIRDHGAAGIGDGALNLADAGLGAQCGCECRAGTDGKQNAFQHGKSPFWIGLPGSPFTLD